MEQVLSFKDPEGHSVSAILSTPEEDSHRIAVLCHGFLSGKNSTTNKALTRLLLDKGIATFRFDFFGHGESQGPFENLKVTTAVKQVLAALDLVTSKGYSQVGLIGSSFGGLVSILAAAKWAPAPAAGRASSASAHRGMTSLALKCPVVDFPEELNLEFGLGGMAEWKRTNTIPDIISSGNRIKLSYTFYEDCLRNVGYQAAMAITAPTLIVQGEEDELIPLHQSRRFFDALKTTRSLCLLPGANHEFSKAEDFHQMTTLLADWTSMHLLAKTS